MEILTQFNAALIRNGQLEDVFMELSKNGISGINMVMKLMKKYNLLKATPPTRKCEKKSNKMREFGNSMFTSKQFNVALHAYNAALLLAPPDSKAFQLAFGNRSALYFHLKKFEACILDIEKCLHLKPPSLLASKLEQRKLDCLKKIKDAKDSFGTKEEEVLHLLSVESNKCKPFTIVNAEDFKVVAAEDIKAGQVIMVEDAFAAALKPDNYYICCYYCLKFMDNLIPCDGCVIAMFCNDLCKEKCLKEFHNIECKVQGFSKTLSLSYHLSLKMLLKIRNLFNTWEDLIAAVNKYKDDPSLNETSLSNDFENVCKMFLNNKEVRPIGKKIMRATNIVLLVHNIVENTNLLKSRNDYKVIDFIFDFLMNLTVTNTMCPIKTMDITSVQKLSGDVQGMGVYTLHGLLNHACNPNVISVDLNQRKILIAIQPILPGEELVLCKLEPYYEMPKFMRERQLYYEHNIVCDCKACAEEWYPKEYNPESLSTEQKNIVAYLSNIGIFKADYSFIEICLKNYKILCTAANLFKDKPSFVLNVEIQKTLTVILYRFQNEINKNNGTNLSQVKGAAMRAFRALSNK